MHIYIHRSMQMRLQVLRRLRNHQVRPSTDQATRHRLGRCRSSLCQRHTHAALDIDWLCRRRLSTIPFADTRFIQLIVQASTQSF